MMPTSLLDPTRTQSRAWGARLQRYWNRPWTEKLFVACYRIKMSFPRFPVPLRLPYGAWWIIQRGSIDHSLLEGTFETAELRFTERFLQRGMTVLDIGANEGLYTLLASKRVGSQGRVFAFEPSPRERRKLRAHVWLNGCFNVKTLPFALGSGAGKANLYVVQGNETGCNSLRPPQVKDPVTPTRVKLRTLDDFLARERLSSVDFVKMDVEGGELDVLKGSTRLFKRPHRPVILVEVSDLRTAAWNYRAKEIILHLQREDYELFSIVAGGNLIAACDSAEFWDTNLVAVPSERREEVLAGTTKLLDGESC